MDKLLNDLRYAIRMLVKSPGYAAIAILTLAVGIGANASIFAVLDASLLHPISAVGDPARLIMIGRTVTSGPYANSRSFDAMSYPNFLDVQQQARQLDPVAAYSSTAVSVTSNQTAEMLTGEMVSGRYFDTLKIVPARGRLLQEADEDPNGTMVAVVGYGLWQRLGGNDDVIGSTIRVGGREVTVVGVAPSGFHGVDPTDITEIWVPLPMEPALLMGNFNYLTSPKPRQMQWLNVFGRRKAGVSVETAKAELATIGQRLASAYPESNKDSSLTAIPGLGLDPTDREEITRLGMILMGAVGLVLLLACANVANLMLARAAARRREMAIRVALGASRLRLVRQVLTESTLLALIAGVCGLLFSVWMTDGLLRLSPGAMVPLPKDVSLNWRVVVAALAVSALTGVLFGIAPALHGFARDVVSTLKETSAQTAAGASRMRPALIVGEVSLALVLMASAGLLIKTLYRFGQVDPGFRTRNLVMFTIFPGLQGYDEARSRQLYQELQRRLEALPGIQAMTAARVRPLNPGGWGSSYEVLGLPGGPRSTQFNTVMPNYFDVMGMDILEGRGFAATDREGAPLVAVISHKLAQTLWPNESAVGKYIKVGNDQQWREIVGVARDVKLRKLNEDPQPYLYMPMSQPMPFWRTATVVELKTDLPQPVVMAAAKNVVREMDAQLPVYAPRTLSQQFAYSYWQQRIAAWLVNVFAAFALMLAALGVYGVISYGVAARTRELGIRIALGAQRGDVLRLVLGGGVRLAAAGVLIGAAASLAANRVLKGLLFGVSASDPTTLFATAALLAAVALFASWVPARRATNLDPMVALRYE